jgi:hypothetical protein
MLVSMLTPFEGRRAAKPAIPPMKTPTSVVTSKAFSRSLKEAFWSRRTGPARKKVEVMAITLAIPAPTIIPFNPRPSVSIAFLTIQKNQVALEYISDNTFCFEKQTAARMDFFGMPFTVIGSDQDARRPMHANCNGLPNPD